MLIAKRYELGETIGTGGMGSVYQGIDITNGECVAIKVIRSDIISSELIARFQRESDALRQLNHPNILRIHDSFNEDSQRYIVTEYVTGGDLRQLLEKKLLTLREKLQIALDVSDALTRSHRLKIIHRDLKPANVLIAHDGTPRLADFGLAQTVGAAHITTAGNLAGTLQYLAPEALIGAELDERSDIWSFGVLLFEMVTGKLPFASEIPGSVIRMILTQPLTDLELHYPTLPAALTDLLYRMLEKDPRTRINSMRLVGLEIEAILENMSSASTGGSTSERHESDAVDDDAPERRIALLEVTPVTFHHNLPAQISEFVGREAETVSLLHLVRGNRLVTVTAPGGMGKSRLAIETALILLSEFTDGVTFVELAPLTDSEQVLPTITDALKLNIERGADAKTQLMRHLQSRKILLVIDNWEHVLDAAPLVTELIAATSNIHILTTSRERLNVTGEQVFSLSGMELPDLAQIKKASDYAVVTLFVQAAQRVRPDFRLEPDAVPHVFEICRLVAGMPLAVILAAGWFEILSVAEIASEIQKGIGFLETDQRDIPVRQRSITAVMDFAWRQLFEPDQLIFAKLSVFVDGFTREAAQSVSGTSIRSLVTLVNKSLLRRSPDGRYEIHELLRQYGAEQLTIRGLNDETFEAHRRYFTTYTHTTAMQLLMPGRRGDIERSTAAVTAEFGNIMLAFDHVLEDGSARELCDFVDVLDAYSFSRSNYPLRVTLSSQIAARLKRPFHINGAEDTEGITALQATFAISLAFTQVEVNINRRLKLAVLNTSLQALRLSPPNLLFVRVLLDIAETSQFLVTEDANLLEESYSLLQEALSHSKVLHLPLMEAYTLYLLCSVYEQRGQVEEIERISERIKELSAITDTSVLEAYMYEQFVWLYWRLKQYPRAVVYARQYLYAAVEQKLVRSIYFAGIYTALFEAYLNYQPDTITEQFIVLRANAQKANLTQYISHAFAMEALIGVHGGQPPAAIHGLLLQALDFEPSETSWYMVAGVLLNFGHAELVAEAAACYDAMIPGYAAYLEPYFFGEHPVLERLKTELTPEQFASANERGSTMTAQSVIAQLKDAITSHRVDGS